MANVALECIFIDKNDCFWSTKAFCGTYVLVISGCVYSALSAARKSKPGFFKNKLSLKSSKMLASSGNKVRKQTHAHSCHVPLFTACQGRCYIVYIYFLNTIFSLNCLHIIRPSALMFFFVFFLYFKAISQCPPALVILLGQFQECFTLVAQGWQSDLQQWPQYIINGHTQLDEFLASFHN